MIPWEELKVEVYDPERSRQGLINRTYHGVQVTHEPSGTVVRYHGARSQHLNRTIAIEMIECALTHPKAGC